MSQDDAARVIQLSQLSGLRWEDLHRACIFHKIAPLVLTNLHKCGDAVTRIPADVKKRWTGNKLHSVLYKENQLRKVASIVSQLSLRSSKVMILKGAALDLLVYDQPWYVESADTDLLVDTPRAELSTENKEALESIKSGWPIELQFFRHHDLDMNRVLDIDYGRIWRDSQEIDFRGQRAYLMSLEDMLLSACINLCRKRFRKLKGILAICEIIRKFPQLDWDRFTQLCFACGANRIAFTALSYTKILMGCSAPDKVYASLCTGILRRKIILLLCRWSTANLVAVPPRRESLASTIVSWILLASSYRLLHFAREARVSRHQQRFRTLIGKKHLSQT